MSAAAPLRYQARPRTGAATLPKNLQIRPAVGPKPVARSRPRLVVSAQQRSTAGRFAFVVVVGGILVGGLVAVLLLHMMAAQDGFRVTALQQRLATLTDQVQEQQQVVAADSAPNALQARADALGMVPTTISAFHNKGNGHAVAVESPMYVPPPSIVTGKPATAKSGAGAAAAGNSTSSKTSKSGTTSKTGTKSKAGTTSTAGTKQSTHHPHHHTGR